MTKEKMVGQCERRSPEGERTVKEGSVRPSTGARQGGGNFRTGAVTTLNFFHVLIFL